MERPKIPEKVGLKTPGNGGPKAPENGGPKTPENGGPKAQENGGPKPRDTADTAHEHGTGEGKEILSKVFPKNSAERDAAAQKPGAEMPNIQSQETLGKVFRQADGQKRPNNTTRETANTENQAKDETAVRDKSNAQNRTPDTDAPVGKSKGKDIVLSVSTNKRTGEKSVRVRNPEHIMNSGDRLTRSVQAFAQANGIKLTSRQMRAMQRDWTSQIIK